METIFICTELTVQGHLKHISHKELKSTIYLRNTTVSCILHNIEVVKHRHSSEQFTKVNSAA